GCQAYAWIPKELRRKWDAKGIRSVLLGYSSASKGYRLFNVQTQKVFDSRSVSFDEGKFGLQFGHGASNEISQNWLPADFTLEDDTNDIQAVPDIVGGQPQAPVVVADQPVVIAAQQQMQAPLPAATVTEFDHADDVFEDAQEDNVRRSGRTRQQVEKYPGMQEFPKNLKLGIQPPVRKHSANVAPSYTEAEPKTVKQALASENSDKW
ncbi:MAG: hypothetical protein GY696_32165, partial [Gammaproteobacteria bacterium]|nr:hypothetical protein [Gammaproteobacteria bacterium]